MPRPPQPANPIPELYERLDAMASELDALQSRPERR